MQYWCLVLWEFGVLSFECEFRVFCIDFGSFWLF